jgi:hypothetical protein
LTLLQLPNIEQLQQHQRSLNTIIEEKGTRSAPVPITRRGLQNFCFPSKNTQFSIQQQHHHQLNNNGRPNNCCILRRAQRQRPRPDTGPYEIDFLETAAAATTRAGIVVGGSHNNRRPTVLEERAVRRISRKGGASENQVAAKSGNKIRSGLVLKTKHAHWRDEARPLLCQSCSAGDPPVRPTAEGIGTSTVGSIVNIAISNTMANDDETGQVISYCSVTDAWASKIRTSNCCIGKG